MNPTNPLALQRLQRMNLILLDLFAFHDCYFGFALRFFFHLTRIFFFNDLIFVGKKYRFPFCLPQPMASIVLFP
jgi:hypothetical protein